MKWIDWVFVVGGVFWILIGILWIVLVIVKVRGVGL